MIPEKSLKETYDIETRGEVAQTSDRSTCAIRVSFSW